MNNSYYHTLVKMFQSKILWGKTFFFIKIQNYPLSENVNGNFETNHDHWFQHAVISTSGVCILTRGSAIQCNLTLRPIARETLMHEWEVGIATVLKLLGLISLNYQYKNTPPHAQKPQTQGS